MPTGTEDSGGNAPTKPTSDSKDPPVLAIVLGVLGGVIVVSGVLAFLTWHFSLLTRLGLRNANRITKMPLLKSVPEAPVEMQATRQGSPRLP